MDKERVSFYDWLRILATICVVVGHSFYLNNETVYGSINYLQLENAQNIYNTFYYKWGLNLVSWIYSFHMALFFFLSGAVLALKPIGDCKRFIIKKAKRLIIPYLCVGYLFMLPIKYIGDFYDGQALKQAAKGLWRGIESGHLWFLLALFWNMIIFAALYKILEKTGLQKITLLLALILQYSCRWIPRNILGLTSGLSMFFWFAVGFEFEKKRASLNKYPLYVWVVIFGLIISTDRLISKFDLIPEWTYIIIRGSIICILAHLAEKCFKVIMQTKIYKLLVKYLFDIYLYHDPLEYFVLFCFFRWDIVSLKFGGCLLILFRIVGVIGLSIGLGCTIEKLKLLKGKVLKEHL